MRPAGVTEVAARAGLAALPVALVGGWIVTHYVYDHIFSWLLPGVLGFAAAVAAGAAVPREPRRSRTAAWLVPLAATVAGLLGTALGFRLVPGGTQSVLHPVSIVGGPYLAAVVGAVLAPAVFGPPQRRSAP